MLSELEKKLTRDFNLEYNFNGYKNKKNLKCSNCKSYKDGDCFGRGFDYKAVLRCMEGKIDSTPIITVKARYTGPANK